MALRRKTRGMGLAHAACLIALSCVTACAEGGEGPHSVFDPSDLVGVTISPGTLILHQGEIAQFQVLAAYGDDSTVDATSQAAFALSTPEAGAITPNGMFQAGSVPGSYTLSVVLAGMEGTAAILVEAPEAADPIREIDFQDYASTAALLADDRTWDPVEQQGLEEISLDTEVGPPLAGLSKSMRYHYRHGGNGCNSITIQRSIRFPPEQEVWSEWYVRWSPNFTTSNSSCIPNDHKLIFGDTQADESGRWAFYVGADTPPSHTIQVERPLGPGGFLGAYYPNRNRDLTPNPDLWDGDWHVIRLYFRNSTSTSSSDGAMKVWIDGDLVHDEFGFNTTNGGGPEFIDGFSFAHNKDDGPPGVDMYLWWGRIRVWNRNPGW